MFATTTQAFVQDAFKVLNLVIKPRAVAVIARLGEEARWRQLLRVAHDDQVLAAGDDANCNPHRNLGGRPVTQLAR